jgi:hypothetical protein
MPVFSALLAMDVRAYATVEIEAPTIEEALEKLRQGSAAFTETGQPWSYEEPNPWDRTFEPEYGAINSHTVVSIDLTDAGRSPSDACMDDIPLHPMDQPYRTIPAADLARQIEESRSLTTTIRDGIARELMVDDEGGGP